MERSLTTVRRLLASRSVAVLFGLQVALLVAVFLSPSLPSPGLETGTEQGFLAIILKPVFNEAVFVNEFIEHLLPPDLKTEDWWLGLLALPIVYYLTAVVLAVSGRAVYRFGRRQQG